MTTPPSPYGPLTRAQRELIRPPHHDGESLFLAACKDCRQGVHCIYAGEPGRALAVLSRHYAPDGVWRLPWERDDCVFLLPGLHECLPLRARGAVGGEGPVAHRDLNETIAQWYEYRSLQHVYLLQFDGWAHADGCQEA